MCIASVTLRYPFTVSGVVILSARGYQRPNKETISLTGELFQVSYPVDSFRPNFFRGIALLWMKTCFLAVIGIAAATCVSFPVASLVSFGVFFAAESVMFLSSALESWDIIDPADKQVVWYRIPAILIAKAVTAVLRFYGQIDPIHSIVDGQLVGWGQVFGGAGSLGLATLLFIALATFIFRRRELAVYSGH